MHEVFRSKIATIQGTWFITKSGLLNLKQKVFGLQTRMCPQILIHCDESTVLEATLLAQNHKSELVQIINKGETKINMNADLYKAT